jgi:hypothetical protein
MLHDGDVSGGGGGTLRRKPQTLKADLARLEDMDTAGLGRAWERRHGSSPPSSALPGRLLRLALAYDLQADVLGGLTPAMESRLARIAAGTNQRDRAKSARLRIKPGATLLRDWGGKSWQVEVEADGTFSFDGRRWRSLSAIAGAITGTSRNGPAFFGLRGGASHGAA